VTTEHVSTESILDYIVGDLADPEGAALEEHLFVCEACAAATAELVETARALGPALESGKTRVVATEGLLAQLERQGVRLRHYHVDPGGRIQCTVAGEDVFVVAHYTADFAGLERVDVLVTDEGGVTLTHMKDVPVDPTAKTLHMLIRADFLRRMPSGEHHVRLVSGDRTLARYLFSHTAPASTS
jgi:Putative zinc-finger